jgi:hypothetical protein
MSSWRFSGNGFKGFLLEIQAHQALAAMVLITGGRAAAAGQALAAKAV